jgi:hypothetical protein
LDGFSLCVWDKSQKLLSTYSTEINIFDKTETEIFDILSQQQELKLNFESIRFIVETSTFTIVPTEMFNAEMGTKALELKFNNISNTDIILSNKIIAWDASIVFTSNPAFYKAIKEVLPQLEIEHHIFSFISYNIALNTKTKLFVRFRKDVFDLILILDGKLSLINTYNAQTAEDFLYYMLKVSGNYQLDNKTLEVAIFNTENKTKHLQLISKHFDNCITETEL